MIDAADGARVALHDLGGDGPPLLMVHGTGLHGRVWVPVAGALADRFHCWSLDLRGHGDSTPPPDPPDDWSGFVRNILAVVDHLGVQGCLAVGHSMGGANLLSAEATRPGTFRALYVYEPVVYYGGDPVAQSQPSIDMALRRRAVFPSLEAVAERYGSRPPWSGVTPEALQAYVEHGFAPLPDGTVQLKCLPEVEAGVFAGFPGSGIAPRLEAVTCPVFLAGGQALDAPTDAPTREDALAPYLPNVEVLHLRGLDHFGPLSAPDVVAASIVECFAGLDAPA